jgi:hypothetical protein
MLSNLWLALFVWVLFFFLEKPVRIHQSYI